MVGLEKIVPILEIILKIFMCVALTNFTGEYSFLILKRVKNNKRTIQ